MGHLQRNICWNSSLHTSFHQHTRCNSIYNMYFIWKQKQNTKASEVRKRKKIYEMSWMIMIVIPLSNSPVHFGRNSFVLLISIQCFQSAKLWPLIEWSKIYRNNLPIITTSTSTEKLIRLFTNTRWMTTKWLSIINYRLTHDVVLLLLRKLQK